MRKITISLLFFAFCFSNQINAQEKISFTAKWQKGKTYTYFLFHNKYNPKNSDYKRNHDTVIINFKTLENNNKGTLLEMKYDFSKAQQQEKQGLKKIIHTIQQTPIELQLDSNGKYQYIQNWQEVKLRCMAELANGKSNAPTNDKDIWDYWKTKVSTQEQIEKMFISDVEFFFMLFGSTLVKNKAFDYEDEMTYGTDVLPANTRLTVKEDSANKKNILVELQTTPDAVKAINQLNQYRRMAKEQEDNPDAMPDKAMFDLQDFYKYAYLTTNSTLQFATYLRYTRKGTKELVEEWFFKQKL